MAEATPPVADDQPVRDPSSNEPQTELEAAKDIADLLTDDLVSEPADAVEEPKEADEDDPLGLNASDDVEEEEGAKPEGSQDKTEGGKYASPDAKFKLSDGTEITVAELARNNLYQRDYSKKTEVLARESEVLTKEKADVARTAQTVREEREFLIWFAEQAVPKPPQPPQVSAQIDPVAWSEYTEQQHRYNQFAQAYNRFKAGQTAEEQRKTTETEAQAQAHAKKEVETLFEKIPVLRDPAKRPAFFDALEKDAAKYYGLNQNQIAELAKQNHLNVVVLRDAIAHKRNIARAPAVQKELAAKPKTVRGSAQRQTQSDTQRRAMRNVTERLRQTGSMQDGIAAIESLIS